MKLSRRNLLKALPSMPFAAQAAKKRAAALMGTAAIGSETVGNYGVSSSGPCTPGGADLRGRGLLKLLRRIGLPAWKRRELRSDARRSRLIDPDLAALRSVSPGWVLHRQWERNEARAKAQLFDWLDESDDRETFMTRHNCGLF